MDKFDTLYLHNHVKHDFDSNSGDARFSNISISIFQISLYFSVFLKALPN